MATSFEAAPPLREQTEEEATRELLAYLTDAFHVFAEVEVSHATFPSESMRPDIVAIPKDPEYSDIAIAFEVKSMAKADTTKVAKALKQASDYVLARIKKDQKRDDGINAYAGWPIVACFLFPAPDWRTEDHLYEGMDADELRRLGDEIFKSGMVHLAGYLRVGNAGVSTSYRGNPLMLRFGPNEVWTSSRGWSPHAQNLLTGKRQIGSKRKRLADLLSLDR